MTPPLAVQLAFGVATGYLLGYLVDEIFGPRVKAISGMVAVALLLVMLLVRGAP